MESIKDLINEHPFFKDFIPEHIEKVTEIASEVSFNPGQYIFRDGEDANLFYLIGRGIISLEVYVPNGGPVTLGRLNAGDVLGWSWLYPPHQWHFDARALEAVRMIDLDGRVLRKMIEEDHEFGFQMMKKISLVMEDRLQATRVKLMEVYDIYPGPDQTRPKWHELI
jgi:CRP-like cAMP-binding protein